MLVHSILNSKVQSFNKTDLPNWISQFYMAYKPIPLTSNIPIGFSAMFLRSRLDITIWGVGCAKEPRQGTQCLVGEERLEEGRSSAEWHNGPQEDLYYGAACYFDACVCSMSLYGWMDWWMDAMHARIYAYNAYGVQNMVRLPTANFQPRERERKRETEQHNLPVSTDLASSSLHWALPEAYGRNAVITSKSTSQNS